ncbi:hypothetical protein GCM10022389_03460 [Flavobacterium cheonanense]|uniref:Uncharacterized protein n=1 Tax=Flavobacterium cheonanense TaxID=706183 RepID=A0ABP7V9D5_9FLAO
MRAYKPCGEFDETNLTAKVYTYLPTREDIGFKYKCFINISNEKHYGIVGILVNNNENIDWSRTNENMSNILVENSEFSLKNLNNKFSEESFEEITKNDRIIFFCYHDDEFDCEIGVDEMDVLKDFQDSMPLAWLLNSKKFKKATESNKVIETESIPTVMKLNIPKVGNGGILTVDGSC